MVANSTPPYTGLILTIWWAKDKQNSTEYWVRDEDGRWGCRREVFDSGKSYHCWGDFGDEELVRNVTQLQKRHRRATARWTTCREVYTELARRFGEG